MKNRIAPELYQLARYVNTAEAILSGDSEKIWRRLKNIILGRLIARGKIWKRLYY